MPQSAPVRRGVFSTNRGQKVKRGLFGFFALALMVMIVNGTVNPGVEDAEQAAEDDDTSINQVEPLEPDVEPAIHDPFSRVTAAPVTAPQAGTNDSTLYSSAATTASAAAVAFGTYSHQQEPETYIELVPSLAPEVREALTVAALANWPEIEGDQVTAVASAGNTQPRMVAFDSDAQTAQVSVTVGQVVTDARGEYHFSRSYLVSLSVEPGEALEPGAEPVLEESQEETQPTTEETEAPEDEETMPATWQVIDISVF